MPSFVDFKVRSLILTISLALLMGVAPLCAHGSDSSLWKILQEDEEGLYLTHIPGIFSIHAVRVRPGIAYSGTVRDPGGWVHITRHHDPDREMVLEQLTKDTIRFLIAPSGTHHTAGFSFQTSTGCFTLRARGTPQGEFVRVHLNGYGPPVRKYPVVLCGTGAHVRVEWQGPIPHSHPFISDLSKNGGGTR